MIKAGVQPTAMRLLWRGGEDPHFCNLRSRNLIEVKVGTRIWLVFFEVQF
jgi:hypothetical protein